jgi:hypothetical protein
MFASGIARLASRTTLTRSRVTLDIAAMLWHRERFKRTKLLQLRYLACDASPQKGVDMFATSERLLTVQPGSCPQWSTSVPFRLSRLGMVVPVCLTSFRLTFIRCGSTMVRP